jgi:hypothetical protein
MLPHDAPLFSMFSPERRHTDAMRHGFEPAMIALCRRFCQPPQAMLQDQPLREVNHFSRRAPLSSWFRRATLQP